MSQEYRDTDNGDSGNAVPDAIDAFSVGSADSGNGNGGLAPEPERSPGKRKGRPPGSKNTGSGKSAGAGKEKASHKLDLSSLTGLFVGVHVIAAGATGVPEVAIDMAEGDAFMKSAQNVMRHYSVESSQKTIDWLAFGGTCCMIYGTRFGAYMLRKRSESQENIRPGATVYQMAPRQPPASSARPAAAPAPAPVPQQDHVAVEMEYDAGE